MGRRNRARPPSILRRIGRMESSDSDGYFDAPLVVRPNRSELQASPLRDNRAYRSPDTREYKHARRSERRRTATPPSESSADEESSYEEDSGSSSESASNNSSESSDEDSSEQDSHSSSDSDDNSDEGTSGSGRSGSPSPASPRKRRRSDSRSRMRSPLSRRAAEKRKPDIKERHSSPISRASKRRRRSSSIGRRRRSSPNGQGRRNDPRSPIRRSSPRRDRSRSRRRHPSPQRPKKAPRRRNNRRRRRRGRNRRRSRREAAKNSQPGRTSRDDNTRRGRRSPLVSVTTSTASSRRAANSRRKGSSGRSPRRRSKSALRSRDESRRRSPKRYRRSSRSSERGKRSTSRNRDGKSERRDRLESSKNRREKRRGSRESDKGSQNGRDTSLPRKSDRDVSSLKSRKRQSSSSPRETIKIKGEPVSPDMSRQDNRAARKPLGSSDRQVSYEAERRSTKTDEAKHRERRKGLEDNEKREHDSSENDHQWGKPETNLKSKEEEITEGKKKPDLSLSGKLAEDTNVFNGVVIKYNEPPEGKKPKRRWRLYVFKGEESLPFIPLHRQSAYLIGRDRKVADIPIDHPSCSKQHAVLQYRSVPYERPDGSSGRRVRPYIIDLESANGTFVNNKRIESRCFVELFEQDVIKFGYSSREYVILPEDATETASGGDGITSNPAVPAEEPRDEPADPAVDPILTLP